jgi:probable phosphoglycerate mutase
VEAALDEVWLGARWQGKTFREIAEDPDLQRYIDDPTFGGDVIEPAAAVQQRVAAFVDRVRAERPGATIAMVSHGDPLRLLIARHLSIALPEFRRLVVSPGTVSLLVIGTRGARVSALSWSPGASALRDLLKR